MAITSRVTHESSAARLYIIINRYVCIKNIYKDICVIISVRLWLIMVHFSVRLSHETKIGTEPAGFSKTKSRLKNRLRTAPICSLVLPPSPF